MISDHKHSLCTRHGEGVLLSNSATELFERQSYASPKKRLLSVAVYPC